MKVKQLISILLMLLLLTACSANTDLDLPDEAGSSEQTSNMDASAAEPEDGAEKPTLPEIETPEGAPDAELVETLLVTVVDNINGENMDDGVELVIYAYDEQSQAFRVIFKMPIGPYVYPANTVDFEHQIVYYASARPDETYDNLYSCDLKTGNVQRLTDGKNAFNDLLFVDGTLYANVAREFCTTCQPARFDLDSQTFTYRNEADDDTWHHSFSYDDYADEFLILTCSDAEMRTHRVAAETHIRPKTISLIDATFENVTPLFFTEDFEICLTRRLNENTILMTTEPQMVSGKRTLKRLDITSQEVENVAIPGIQQVHMFYPSLDGNTLYFVGQAEGKTIWNVYRYALDTQELTQLTFPKQPDRIIDIQITHQPCGPDFSHGCCVLEDEGLKNLY